jgi:hypothetical protein
MEFSVFHIENAEPHEYGLPPPAERRSAPTFWGWIQGMVSGQEAPPDETVPAWVEAVRRRDARIAALNAPSSPIAAIASEVADHIGTAVKKVVRKITKKQQAIAWLWQVTERGPVPQTELVKAGAELGLSLKVLKSIAAGYMGLARRVEKRIREAV